MFPFVAQITLFALISLAVHAGQALATEYADLQDKQCNWYPKTCENGKPTSQVDASCLDAAICDELGKKYSETTWPTSAEALVGVSKRYVAQHEKRRLTTEISSQFAENLALLLVGFLTTSVCGGLIAAALQQRSWNHQWNIQRQKDRDDAARAVFEEVSRLMDRRLFRINQLFLWCGRKDRARTKTALAEYRLVLAEWNDSINRHLAMLQFYFGQPVREKFDYGVGKKFVDVGALVEQFYNNHEKSTDKIEKFLSELKSEVYDFNLAMLGEISARNKLEDPSASQV